MGLAFGRRIFNGFVAFPVFPRQTSAQGIRHCSQDIRLKQVETRVADQAVK